MIPVFEPLLSSNELHYINECIADNWITGGKKCAAFEDRIKRITSAKHATVCCNGTLALYVGLKAMGIGNGDEVIVPDFTFIASANSVYMTGATPVFCDVDPVSFCIRARDIDKVKTRKTRAVMPVGIYGNSPNMDEITEYCCYNQLDIIEDAAQNMFVKWNNKHLGTFGWVGCISFYADKTITTGEGGMILTDDDDLYEQVIRLLNQGRTGRGRYIHDSIGYNFRMTDLQAAVGLAQLDKAKFICESKLLHEQIYKELLSSIEDITFPVVDNRCEHMPFRHNILVPDPEALSKHLADNDIGSLRFFHPLHRQDCYKKEYSHLQFPNTELIYEHGLSLPSSVKLTRFDIEKICEVIRRYYEN
jgi:perosamine synthetase